MITGCQTLTRRTQSSESRGCRDHGSELSLRTLF